MSKESELQRLRRDVSVKTSQIRCMDENLQQVKSQLDSKSDIGMTCNFVICIVQEALMPVIFIYIYFLWSRDT